MSEPLVPVVNLHELTKVYHGGGGDVVAVDRLSLSIPPGVSVLAGPSGCGKSTLINLLGAMDLPTSGLVEVASQKLQELTEDQIDTFRRRTVGIVFQFFHLMPVLTVLENVALPAELAGTPHQQSRQRAASLLDRVGLSHRADHRPHELSGGEVQRTAIARALVNRPAVVLADEPTGNLDSENAEGIMDLLTRCHQQFGQTVVVVTHNPAVAQRAERILTMRDGRICDC